jgi:hypothetical protein
MTGFNVYALDNGLSSEKILGCLEQNDAHGPLRNRFATMQAMGCAASRHDSLPFVPGTNNGALTRIRHSLGAKEAAGKRPDSGPSLREASLRCQSRRSLGWPHAEVATADSALCFPAASKARHLFEIMRHG